VPPPLAQRASPPRRRAQRPPATKTVPAKPRTGCACTVCTALFADLATFIRNQVTTRAAPRRVLTTYPKLTPIEQKAFELLAVNPTRTQ
jgi:hypothetical protein